MHVHFTVCLFYTDYAKAYTKDVLEEGDPKKKKGITSAVNCAVVSCTEFENGISLNHNSKFKTKSKFVNIFKYNWMLTHPSVVKDILKQNDIFTDLFLKFVCPRRH